MKHADLHPFSLPSNKSRLFTVSKTTGRGINAVAHFRKSVIWEVTLKFKDISAKIIRYAPAEKVFFNLLMKGKRLEDKHKLVSEDLTNTWTRLLYWWRHAGLLCDITDLTVLHCIFSVRFLKDQMGKKKEASAHLRALSGGATFLYENIQICLWAISSLANCHECKWDLSNLWICMSQLWGPGRKAGREREKTLTCKWLSWTLLSGYI